MGLHFYLFDSFSYERGLPMSAAVTAAAVSAATATVKSTAAHRATATNRAAVESTADRYM
jgi:hypothetical protein